jgi:ATP-dependent DNA helicase RecG
MRRIPRLSKVPEELTEDEFWDLFGRMEHQALDFKESPNHLTAIIAAMAMTDGGIVAVGVSDQREIVGCPLDQKTQDKIVRTAHSCGVDVQLKEIGVGGRPLTIIAIPEIRGHIVTTPDGRLLRRVGSDNQPLIGDALGRFVFAREERAAEEEPAAGFQLDEIDLDLVNQALAGDGRPRASRRNLMRSLIDLGVATVPEPPLDPQVLRAGATLFARDPRKYLSGASLQVVRRSGVGPGPGPVSAREEIAAPIAHALARAVEFIDAHTGHHEAVVGTHREAVTEYPVPVLREALLNALAHRDYGLAGATVDVTVWDDRIEIRSPGSLPGHITVGNMREEHYSRNRRIMRVLKLLNLVEEYGEGVDRMFNEMEARLMEPPHFVATSSSVAVTLYNRSILSIEDQAWLSLLGHMDLSPPERRTLVLARHEGAATPRRLRAVLGDELDVEALLGSATAKGLLVRVGQRGGTRYVLSDEVVMRAGGGGVEARSRKRQMLLDEIRRRGSLSTAEAADYLDERDRNMVRQMLGDLVRSREVVAEGRTRARRYYPARGPRRRS